MKIKNPFSEKWKGFKSALDAQSLAEEFKPKPFIEKAKGLYYAALSGTYLSNIVSAASELALVLYVLSLIIPWMWLTVAVSVLIVAIIEWFKRSTAWHVWHGVIVEGEYPIGFIATALLLFAISATGSVIGANWAIRSIAEQGIEKVSYEPQITAIEKDMAKLDATINEMRKQRTSKGEIPYRAQKAINQALEQRKDLVKQRAKLQELERKENSALYVKSMQDIDSRAYSAVWLILLFEIIFQVSFRFTKLFRFRSAVEMGLISGIASNNGKANIGGSQNPFGQREKKSAGSYDI